MLNRKLFVGAYLLFLAFGLVGCGGGGVQEGMPADTKPNDALLKQEQEAGRRAEEQAKAEAAKKK